MAVVGQWASVDPQAASAWVTGFPAGETRDNALRQVVSSWAHADPSAASQWLASLSADKSRERLVQQFIGTTTYEYPEMAAAWVETIADPNQRFNTAENVGRTWLQYDRVAATKWINQTSLPDEKKQQLLKSPQN
jgi:hypothetical protein